MRLLLAFVCLVFATAVRAEEPKKAASPAGLWYGVLKIGAIELRVAIQLDADKEGKLSGKFISLDQNKAEVQCKTVTFKEGKLELDLPDALAVYKATLDEAGKKLTGEFIQAGTKHELNLERVDKLPEWKRPQHPKPPYPYLAEEVTFENSEAKIKLAGTLTLPKGDGPFPAVVLVSGSGPQDRDETLMEHKPFLVIADHLTRAGIAVLRYDDRGVGKSKGEFKGATSKDFATDAHAAVKYLLGRKEIDKKRVGIAGHSEGGLIGPMAAADHPEDVGFLILLAGPGLPGASILKTQNRDILLQGKATEEELKANTEFFDAILPLAASDLSKEKLKAAIAEKVEEALKKLTDETKRKLAKNLMAKLPDAMADEWMRYFLSYDPAPTLKNVKCPVLALNGGKDIQVRSKENLEAIAAALKASGNANFATKDFPDLNHLFQACKTGAVSEYGSIEETFNADALKAMTEWIGKLK